MSRSFYNHFIFYIIYADIFILIKLCCSAGPYNMSSDSLHIGAMSILSYCHIKHFKLDIYTITLISWRYSDLISRSFYNHFIFYIIYTDIFILIKLCYNMSSDTLHIGARSIVILFIIKHFKLNILVRTCFY